MKLRNKKTGKIYNACSIWFGESLDGLENTKWKTLNEFCEEWEDCAPAESLIKDKKMRKVVRVWADANEVTKVYVYGIGDGEEYIELYAKDDGVVDGKIRISLPTQDGVRIGEEYAIAELCGEEEE